MKTRTTCPEVPVKFQAFWGLRYFPCSQISSYLSDSSLREDKRYPLHSTQVLAKTHFYVKWLGVSQVNSLCKQLHNYLSWLK